MKRNLFAQWAIVWTLALAGCVAPLPGPVIQEAAPACPDAGATTQEDTGAQDVGAQIGYDPSAVILIGLAGDIATVGANLDESGSIRVDVPFEGADPGQPDPGLEQPLWFPIFLTEDAGANLEWGSALFNVPSNNLDQPALLVVAKTAVHNNSDAVEITEQNLAVLALAQVQAVSDVLYAEGALQLPVFAQLNSTVTLPRPGVSFDPNGVGAHPCGKLGIATGASPSMFWDQWALHALPGMNVFPGGVDHGCAAASGAADPVQVVVFDTSPVDAPAGAPLGVPYDTLHIPLAAPCGPADLEIELSSYIPPSAATSSKSQHGLFAGGLVYATWRHANIHLARVLDNNGHGDLYTLLMAMVAWREQLFAAGEPGVFNLSLGLDANTVNFSPEEQALWNDLLSQSAAAGAISSNYQPLPVDDPAVVAQPPLSQIPEVALETTVRLVTSAGIVIVAAAGNDAGLEQYPAVYEAVLGVAATGGATDAGGQVTRACYSSDGDVAAPGGDAWVKGSSDTSTDTGACVATAAAECTTPDCANGVMSVVTLNDPTAPYGLAFWNGTSFAAPLVSGLVAQRIANDGGTPPPAVDLVNFVLSMRNNCADTTANSICIADLEGSPSLP